MSVSELKGLFILGWFLLNSTQLRRGGLREIVLFVKSPRTSELSIFLQRTQNSLPEIRVSGALRRMDFLTGELS